MKVLSIDPGRKNFGVAIVDIPNQEDYQQNVVSFWNVSELPESPMDLVKALDDMFPTLHDIDVAVIERQPPKNYRMQRLQHHLEMYFVMRRLPVDFIDARIKLIYAETTPYWRGTTGAKNIKSYVRRKKLAVGVIQRYLEERPDHHADALYIFRRAKKQDDYADCLLQALAYVHHSPEEEHSGPKKIKCLPAPKPAKPGVTRLIKSNVVYLLQECTTEEQFHDAFKSNQILARAFQKFFKTIDFFIERREKTVHRQIISQKKKEQKLLKKHQQEPHVPPPPPPLDDIQPAGANDTATESVS